jgi:endoglucanase
MTIPFSRKRPTAALSSLSFLALLNGVGLATPGVYAAEPNYGEVLQKSLYFYEAQMAGPLPQGYRIPWRGPAGFM